MNRFTANLAIVFWAIFISSLCCSGQNMNDYERWLEFHEIQDSDFQKYGNDKEGNMKWYEYNLTEEYKEMYYSFRIYSTDSIYFIDLDSYSLTLERENGQLVSYGSEVDTKVQVIHNGDNRATTLLFCGTDCYFETANWTSDETLQVLGFSLDNNDNFVPTKWTVDLGNMLFSEYRVEKNFTEMPQSYMEKERLKLIEFKE